MTIVQTASLLWVAYNGIVFFIYGLDKGKARKGYYRISEKTLLLLTVFGGVGALCGGQFFHHKTKKWYFQVAWWLFSILNVVLLYWIWKEFG
ncbi:DUF1294 domain-containing protein [Streptococcus cameli]